MNQIFATDTTLLSSEHAAGVAFFSEEKLGTAKTVGELGIREIKCGISTMGDEDPHAVVSIMKLGLSVQL